MEAIKPIREMSPAARSVLAFGLYLACGGILLVFLPGTVCLALGLRPPVETLWIRLCGMFFLDLAFYCVRAAQGEFSGFFRLSVFTRSWTVVFLLLFVVFGLVRPMILIFGLIDVMAALWTGLALRGTRPGACP